MAGPSLAGLGRLVEDAWDGEAGVWQVEVIPERLLLASGTTVMSDFGS
jgi:hypothetical protein